MIMINHDYTVVCSMYVNVMLYDFVTNYLANEVM